MVHSSNDPPNPPPPTSIRHAPGAVRHAEKRRTGTCEFADRIAQVSVTTYHSVIPESFRLAQPQTCVATIVAHFDDGFLQVLSMGVGTKFLSESVLAQEHASQDVMVGSDGSKYQGYGMRIRDCHAEVLCRRAFQRYLYREMAQGRTSGEGRRPILERLLLGDNDNTCQPMFRLKPGITIHLYSSSAPCGNSTLKKFQKMQKETYDASLGPNEWCQTPHENIEPHSVQLGQFSLLLKRDSTVQPQTFTKSPQKKNWPAHSNADWCPPGTTVVTSNQGSTHSCSDKICRWNFLGLQGGLLSSLVQQPIYMTTLVVGRKFTSSICRRAVCCRMNGRQKKWKPHETGETSSKFNLHHPAVLGTGVYLSEKDVIAMSDTAESGLNVRFESPLSWAWWYGSDKVECINGVTGFALTPDGDDAISCLSTAALTRLHRVAIGATTFQTKSTMPTTVESVRLYKHKYAPDYEEAKERLLTNHWVFQDWRRRAERDEHRTGAATEIGETKIL